MTDTITLPRAAAQRLLDDLNARIDRAPATAVPVFDGIVELHDALGSDDYVDPAAVAHAATIVLSWCAHVQRFTYERRSAAGMDASPHMLAGAAHGLALAALKPLQRAAFASPPAPVTRATGLDVSIVGGRPGYVEKRLVEGGLQLASGSPTMLQDEFARYEAEATTPAQRLDAATVERCAALREAVAKVLPIGNDRLPDDKVVPIYVRMDELRAIHRLATEPHQHGGEA